MRLVTGFVLAAFCSVPAAWAQTTPDEVCELTADIVKQAQELRVDGASEKRAVRVLRRSFSDQSDAIREKAIPMLVNDYVYAQPDAVMEEDLSAFWKQTCLTTDLSSVFGDAD